MLKKIIPKLLFIAIILATLTACGNGNSSSGENTMAGTSSVTQEAVTDSQPVTLEYILSHTDLTAEDFSGIDFNDFTKKMEINSSNIDEYINYIPRLLQFYKKDLVAEKPRDFSYIYDEADGKLSESDLDKLDIMLLEYHESDFNQYMVIEFSSGNVYMSMKDIISTCYEGNKVATLTQEDREWIREALITNEVASWDNEYKGTSQGTTGHFAVGYAFRLTDGRCVSYVASGVRNSGMHAGMNLLSIDLIDRFGEN